MEVTSFLATREKKLPLFLQFVLRAKLKSSVAASRLPWMNRARLSSPLFLNDCVNTREISPIPALVKYADATEWNCHLCSQWMGLLPECQILCRTMLSLGGT